VQTVTPLSENTGLASPPPAITLERGASFSAIQVDLAYEYHYERKVPEHPAEVKLTDSGRPSHRRRRHNAGHQCPAPKLTNSRKPCSRRRLFPFDQVSAASTRSYLARAQPITKSFEVDDTVLRDLRAYMSKHNSTTPNLNERKSRLDQAQDQARSLHVQLRPAGRLEGSARIRPASTKTVEAIRKLRLYENARKIVAQRTGITPNQP